jgi:D-glycero-D-manno-heptose 1,7-bisphosphate phosphatase
MTDAAVFLDRDDTLVVDGGYTHRVEDFVWVKGADAALRRLHRSGIRVFVITNQGGIGLGLFSELDMHRFHSHLRAEAVRSGGQITDIAFCPHHPSAPAPAYRTPCQCRKPAPGMLLGLAEKWHIDLARSVVIGDRQSDLDAGLAAGCHSYLFECGDLDALVQKLLPRHFSRGGDTY